jgi:hypothetical protein
LVQLGWCKNWARANGAVWHEEITSALPADLDGLPHLNGFRLRGMQMTRLETFIDAAFAFAITMLVELRDFLATVAALFKTRSPNEPATSASA